MSAAQALLVVLAGVVAGAFNTIAGGGALLTFPVLVAIGLTPLSANISNTVGMVPAALGGVAGFRDELRAQWPRLVRLLPVVCVGGVGGGVLLLVTPSTAFDRVVPELIVAACVVLLFQGVLRTAIESRRGAHRAALVVGVFFSSIYGGYFGAAVSVIIIAILAITIDDTLPRLNALKVPLVGAMNLVSGIVFILFGPVHWIAVAVLAPSTLIGGRIGASLARRIPPTPLRIFIVAFGLAGATWLAFYH